MLSQQAERHAIAWAKLRLQCIRALGQQLLNCILAIVLVVHHHAEACRQYACQLGALQELVECIAEG